VADADGIAADHVRTTVDYCATTDPFGYFFFLAVYRGHLRIKSGRDETIVPAGETTFYPLNVPLDVGVFGACSQMLRLPTARLAAVAEEIAGADLRFGPCTRRSGATTTPPRRWGWTSPSQFTAAYRRRFGVPPSQTLRS
jgi:hypothetical protein